MFPEFLSSPSGPAKEGHLLERKFCSPCSPAVARYWFGHSFLDMGECSTSLAGWAIAGGSRSTELSNRVEVFSNS